MSIRRASLRPIWLVTPGRWSGLGRVGARWALGIVTLLVVLACTLARGIAGDPIDGSTGLALVDASRHGGDYYAVLADVVRSAGVAALGWTTPLPTLFVIEARIPAWLASTAMMLLATGVVVAWYARSGGLLATRTARTIALLLMLAGMAVALRLPLVASPEGWAGLLVALSLARRGPGRMVETMALGTAAVTLSAAALAWCAVMALAAGWERAWRESVGWALVAAVGVMLVMLHDRAMAVALAGCATDPAMGMLAFGPILAALGAATGLRLLPVAVVAALVVLATIGWAGRRESAAPRVTLSIVVVGIWVAVLDAPNAALIVAPLLPLGLIAVPDAIRDLAAAAFDRRRITVTRLGREGLAR